MLHAFICFFPHRNHQCGLQLVIWQVTYRSPPSLSCPLSPSLPSVPPFPFPLSIFSPIPLSPSTKIHHAYQGVPHPHAHECGGVPHRPALYDPGEVTTPYCPPNSQPHTHTVENDKVMQKTSSQRGDTLTQDFSTVWSQCAQLWNDWSHGVWHRWSNGTKRASVLIDYPI